MAAGLTRRAALAWASAAASPLSRAQGVRGWPVGTVTLVLPAPSGGALDAFARLLAEALGGLLGQRFLVDNRAGAGGLIAARRVAQVGVDGHTLAVVHSGFVTLQAMDSLKGPLTGLRPVAKVSRTALALTVRADARYQSVSELIDAVRGSPGRFSFASGGLGSPAHLATLRLGQSVGGLELVHVPYKGGGEADVATAAGDVDFNFSPIGTALPLLRAGRLRALALTSRDRWPAMPQLETMVEAGYPDLVIEPWVGLAAARSASDRMMGPLGEALRQALGQPGVIRHLPSLGAWPDFALAEPFAAQIERELKIAALLVRRLGPGLRR